jgi:hypothetical protein
VGDILHVGRTLGASIEDDHIDKGHAANTRV